MYFDHTIDGKIITHKNQLQLIYKMVVKITMRSTELNFF